jgi:hypothetical protein
VGGTCAIDSGADLPRNREGSNNCYFYGIGGLAGGNQAKSAEPYGLPTPLDDDAPNGYCSRSDGFLTGLDKSVSCESATDCNAAGPPYATVRSCSLWKTCTIATGKGCLTNTDCVLATEGTCDPTKPKPCVVDSPDCGAGLSNGANPVGGACNVTTFAAVCNLPNAVADEYVQKNGPGRNYGIQVSNGPDMRFNLQDIYGDTGNDFRPPSGSTMRTHHAGHPAGYGRCGRRYGDLLEGDALDLDSHIRAGGECALDGASGCLRKVTRSST